MQWGMLGEKHKVLWKVSSLPRYINLPDLAEVFAVAVNKSNTNLSSCISHGVVCSEASKWRPSNLPLQVRGGEWVPRWHHSRFSPSFCSGWLQLVHYPARGKEEGKRFWLVCAVTVCIPCHSVCITHLFWVSSLYGVCIWAHGAERGGPKSPRHLDLSVAWVVLLPLPHLPTASCFSHCRAIRTIPGRWHFSLLFSWLLSFSLFFSFFLFFSLFLCCTFLSVVFLCWHVVG